MYFAVEGAGVGDVFLGGVGVDWGMLVGLGWRQLGRGGCASEAFGYLGYSAGL